MSQPTAAVPVSGTVSQPNPQASTPPPPAAPGAAPWGTPGPAGNGSTGAYTPGSGSKGGRRDHPAMQYGDVGSPQGHIQYCARVIADAKTGRGGVTEQTGSFTNAVKQNKVLTWSQKRMVIMKMKWADRRLAGAYEAVARQAARKAKARQDADAQVLEMMKKSRKPQKAGVYTPGGTP